MFERYTEKARRTIFFARNAASTYGSSQIHTEHLLLGLLSEPNPMWEQLLGYIGKADVFRLELGPEAPPEKRIPTSKEMPLCVAVKDALRFAVEEADNLNRRYIGTKDLLVGLMRIEDCRALQILKACGVEPEKVIDAARKMKGSD